MGGYFSTRWGGHARRRMIGEGTLSLPARAVADAIREARRSALRGSVRTPDKMPEGGADRGAANDTSRTAQAEVVQEWEGFLHWPAGLSAEWVLEELEPGGQLDQPDQSGHSRLTLWRSGTRPAPGDRAGGQVIHLDQVPQPLGGVRWWMRCPTCDRRRGALYLTPATATAPVLAFRCRECLGLTYRTSQAAPMDRLYIRARKLARRLGADDPMGWIDRPRGMHRATFERRLDELHDVLAARDRVWLVGAARIVERIDRRRGIWRG